MMIRVWNSELLVDGKQVTFKIDTGAEVTAISKATWQSLGKPDLQSPSKLLYGPAKKPLKTTHFTSLPATFPTKKNLPATDICGR